MNRDKRDGAVQTDKTKYMFKVAVIGGRNVSKWREKIVELTVTAIPSRKQDFPSDQYYLNC